MQGDIPEAIAGAWPGHNSISSNMIIGLPTNRNGKGCRPCGKEPLKKAVLLVKIYLKYQKHISRSKFKIHPSIPALIEYLMDDNKRVHVERCVKNTGRDVLFRIQLKN